MGRDRQDREYGTIDGDTGLPVEYVSCPGCGFRYGYRNRKACKMCDECSECCRCVEPVLITGREQKMRAAENA